MYLVMKLFLTPFAKAFAIAFNALFAPAAPYITPKQTNFLLYLSAKVLNLFLILFAGTYKQTPQKVSSVSLKKKKMGVNSIF